MDQFKLVTSPIEALSLADWQSPTVNGGHVFFYGTVRCQNIDREVIRLEFEAYESMVFRELERIAIDIRKHFPIHSLLLIHRLGIVLPGETAVVAAASAFHRSEAFSACAMLMNELKKSVPIWKKEVFSSGEEWVSAFP